MTAWTLMQCLYLVAGGMFTPAISAALFGSDRAWAGGAPVPAFVVIMGVLLLWPMLVLLLVQEK